MKLITHRAMYGGDLGQEHEIYYLGDVHAGAKLCHKKAFLRTLREIAAKDPAVTHLILMGDHGDYINRSDFRFDEEEIDPDIINLYSGKDPNEQTLEWLESTLTPMKPYIRAGLRGNHGQKDKASGMWQRYDRKLFETRYLDIEHAYGGYSAFVRIVLEHQAGGNRRSIVSHIHHGWQGGRKKGAKVNQLETEISMFPSADILMRGHSHDLFVLPFDSLVPNQRFDDVVAKKVLVGHTGTFLRTTSTDTEGYAERAGFRPAAVGCVKVTVRVTDEGYELEGAIRC